MSLALSRSRDSHLIFGCGYLGRRVAALWQRQNRPVIAVTRSPKRCEEFRRDGLMPHIADICEPETLRGLPDAECVLFAVGYDRNSGKTRQEVFVDGLRNVLTEIGPRCRRFIYVSSTSVYGQQDGGWVDETSPCEPMQPGGMCCLAGEKLVRDLIANSQASTTSAVALRLAGIYGPDRLLSRITDLKAGKPLSGKPEAWLNLIHVDDAAAAVIAAAEWNGPRSQERQFEVFLVCDDRPVQRGEYYSRLAQLAARRRRNSIPRCRAAEAPANSTNVVQTLDSSRSLLFL